MIISIYICLMEFLKTDNIITTIAIVFKAFTFAFSVCVLSFMVSFLYYAIKQYISSNIIIKGNKSNLNYRLTIDDVLVSKASGAIYNNKVGTGQNNWKYEPDALKASDAVSSALPNLVKATEDGVGDQFNYDETDGIPPVDRPLFKPADRPVR